MSVHEILGGSDMISLRSVLREVPDSRGKKGQLHRLEAILGLILLSMLSGRKGMIVLKKSEIWNR